MSVAATTPAVRVRGLEKDFGDGPVVQGLDFDVPAGEITLVMGPNGVGKTILLSCIAGGLHADGGEIEVFGRAPEQADAAMNFMLQNAMLVGPLSGRANVEFFQELHPKSTDRWRTVLEELSFDMDALDREVGDYSGGMQRKLELALTLTADVPLLLLDEPTAALDMTTVDRVHALLTERTEAGDTVVMTSHLPGDTPLADHLVLLNEDGLVATGAPDDLLAAVPRVVEAEGVTAGLEMYVRDGRLFEANTSRRGFLRADVSAETVRGASDDAGSRVDVREPTYTDLFNYHVYIQGGTDE